MKDDIRMNLVTPREDESLFLERAVTAPFRDTSHCVERDDDEADQGSVQSWFTRMRVVTLTRSCLVLRGAAQLQFTALRMAT